MQLIIFCILLCWDSPRKSPLFILIILVTVIGPISSHPRNNYVKFYLHQVLLDDVTCHGTERHISQCRHRGWRRSNCNNHEDASVSCHAPALQGHQVSMVTRSSSRLSNCTDIMSWISILVHSTVQYYCSFNVVILKFRTKRDLNLKHWWSLCSSSLHNKKSKVQLFCDVLFIRQGFWKPVSKRAEVNKEGH